MCPICGEEGQKILNNGTHAYACGYYEAFGNFGTCKNEKKTMIGVSNYEFLAEITMVTDNEVMLVCKKSFGDNPNNKESVWPRNIFRGEEPAIGKQVLFRYCCKPKDIYTACVL